MDEKQLQALVNELAAYYHEGDRWLTIDGDRFVLLSQNDSVHNYVSR